MVNILNLTLLSGEISQPTATEGESIYTTAVYISLFSSPNDIGTEKT